MKNKNMQKFLLAVGFACACGAGAWAQVAVPSTFKHITIDGSFGDWTGVPVAYTATEGTNSAIQYENVYIANDQNNLYIRFTLYTPRANAFENSYDNIFIDADDNPATGFSVGGIGSEMLIQWGGGYQETNNGFNVGTVTNLGWAIAGSADNTDFEVSISLGAAYETNGLPVFSTNSSIAILLEGDNSSYQNEEFVPPSGGLVYAFASAPTPLTTNLPLVTLTNSSWEVNASGTDLGTNWLGQDYDDTGTGWTSGPGLFGYTTSPASYPPINTPLSSGPNTYYFRTHVEWTNDTANVAFVVTNYLSDGAVYYVNGVEVRRIRMPAGTVSYATAAAATNSPVGHADVFGIDGGFFVTGDNILEVETHQAAGSSADMVFGLALTAAIHYPVLVASTNLPADQTVLAGQPVTFTSDVIGSGPLTYQWFFNVTNTIAGANSAAYTIPLVLGSNAGSYSLLVSNPISSVTTRAAVLTVSNTPVIIVTEPANQIAVEGTPATFTVAVSATPPISYQWFFGTSLIPGATNASYTIPYCLPTNAGGYSVTVSNPASTTNSSVANLTVLADTVPPNIVNIVAGGTQIVVTFSEPVDSATAGHAANYTLSGGVNVLTAVQNPLNAAQVTLTTSVTMNFGTVYSLTVNGVKDLFGNAAHVTGQFARDITIDGSFDDWAGLAPSYSTAAPSGNTDAADFEDIYVYNDANYYYFRVTLWTDIDPLDGQFPYYVNMFFDTDNNPTTGYQAVGGEIGSEMLIQSGYSYQEKDGNWVDGFGINGLNWLCLPASPGTNFEFQLSRSATFGEDGTPVFTTNIFNFLFQGMTPGFVVENQAPLSGVISYTNVTFPTVPSLPLSGLSISPLSGGQAAIVWSPPGTLQSASALNGSWTNLPAATSPYVIPVTGAGQFFRLTQ
jgi:hypothetical protein